MNVPYVMCVACGKAGSFPGMPPHDQGMCPVLVAESDARLRLLIAQERAANRAASVGSAS